jgi:hypothetical protein
MEYFAVGAAMRGFLRGQFRRGGRLQRAMRDLLRRHGLGAMTTIPRRSKIAL